ncbi:MAG: hypothetical protein II887_02325 [Bacteroidales bacterium]|nr:hypothetical protein [Bacteroidales bacterium]
MNNTFNFKRFGQVLSRDWKRYIHNFGITLLVWISIPIMFWVTSLVFDFTMPAGARVFVIGIIVAITIMSAPSRIYGKVNLPREGVEFAMLPVTSLEKFLSMFIYCSILTPLLTVIGCWIVDCLMTLLPFGGFSEFISLQIPREALVMIVAIITSVWVESSFFMFGNMLFKRRKAGKTFGWILLFLFTFVIIMEITGGWMLFDYLFSGNNNIANVWIYSAIMFVIACLFYFGTYRKIKNQKY